MLRNGPDPGDPGDPAFASLVTCREEMNAPSAVTAG